MIIYKYRNTVNGKAYIGLTTSNIADRFRQHCQLASKLRRDGKRMPYFYYALMKYGPKAFDWEVLYEGKDLEDLKAAEIRLIAEHDTIKNGYNMSRGGDSGLAGMRLRLSHKRGISRAQLASWKSERGEKRRAMLSEKMKGNTLGKARRGKKHSDTTKDKISAGNLGKTRTKEQKLARSELMKNLWEETPERFNTEARRVATSANARKAQEAWKGSSQTDYQKRAVTEANQKVWIVTRPDGTEIEIVNLLGFCRDNGLDQGNLAKTENFPGRKHKGYSARKKGS